MNAITRETLGNWTQKCNWLKVNEAATPDGRQHTFLTPSGNLIVVQFDLKGNLYSVGQVVPQLPASGIPKNVPPVR